MGADKVAVMYVNQAQVLEEQGKFKEAEKLYISVHEPDLAITMYKKQRQFDQVCFGAYRVYSVGRGPGYVFAIIGYVCCVFWGPCWLSLS